MASMTRDEKRELAERSIERAAEVVGDITQPTLDRFYARFPEAKAAFLRLAGNDCDRVEARMVENCLYCMMYWFGRPGEVRGVIEDQIPHHIRTLEVSAQWYWEMLHASLEVVMETIPPEAQDEIALWSEMSEGLKAMIANAAEA